jgi:hypothetical protein
MKLQCLFSHVCLCTLWHKTVYLESYFSVRTRFREPSFTSGSCWDPAHADLAWSRSNLINPDVFGLGRTSPPPVSLDIRLPDFLKVTPIPYNLTHPRNLLRILDLDGGPPSSPLRDNRQTLHTNQEASLTLRASERSLVLRAGAVHS